MKNTVSENPLLNEWNTSFGVPPFGLIKEDHYIPAFEKSMALQKEMIDRMVESRTLPTFENTIEVLEKSHALLSRVMMVFYNMTSAHTNDRLQEILKKMAPVLAQHKDDILMNEDLFSRIKSLFDRCSQLNLSSEQSMVLKDYYNDFARGGANLGLSEKEKLRKINKRLSLLSVQFGENILNGTKAFELIVSEREALSGLPLSVIEGAREAAEKKKYHGKWLFTLRKPSLIPFLQYADDRHLREKIFRAYIEQGNNGDERDNKKILIEIVGLRIQRAKLLGYETHAHYVLEENMAGSSGSVYRLLDELWAPAIRQAEKEAEILRSMIRENGKTHKLEPWDWWYYTEKVRSAEYDLDENMIRPYFELSSVRQGAFDVATKLFGLVFEKRSDIPVYHEEVESFEVKEKDGTHIGILLTDYFPRESKQSGAWMTEYRRQHKDGGKMVSPIVVNVGNFSRPVKDMPSLLSLSETLTLFHEFGHALHGLLSNCEYEKLSGTSVPRDFVELPSQLMENWALEPQVMKMYARHYETGEVMPDVLIEKIQKSLRFNQGFESVEYLAAAYLDMDWHTLEQNDVADALSFENQSMQKLGLIPEIVARYRSPYFLHIFSSVLGYSAGYYSYYWAQVLDADAFQLFKEKGLFDKETAVSLRKYIYSTGGTDEPMALYVKFRGGKPNVEPLLVRKGFRSPEEC